MGGDETLEFVAVDIETTGFDVDAAVTVVGFALPLGVRVLYQTSGRPPETLDGGGVEAAVRERTDEHVVVSAHDSEAALLEAIQEFAATRFRDEDILLVGYNAETWRSGFDLPFLRSRFAAQDAAWPFRDIPYADVMPVITDRFNTTVDGEAKQDLDGVYEVLCQGDYGALDPFADSAEAVTAFEDGRFTDLLVHNVADVLRTRALGQLAERYCSKSDFSLKSLTPVSDA